MEKQQPSKPIRPEIIEVQESILNQILLYITIIAPFAILPTAYNSYMIGRWYNGIFLIFLYILCLLIYARRSVIPYAFRAGLLILIFFLTATTTLNGLGLSGVGPEMLILGCFISSILFSYRTSLKFIGLGTLLMAFFGYGMSTGLIPANTERLLNSFSGIAWFLATTVFVIASLLAIISSQMLTHRLEKSLELAEEQADSLQVSNQRLLGEIEKRELAEAEQTHLRLLLQNIIDSMPSLLVAIDKEFRITQWNGRVIDFLGASPGDTLGRAFTDYFPKLSYQLPIIHKAFDDQEPQTIEKLSIDCNNQIYFIDILIYPITGGVEKGAVIKIDNVTDGTFTRTRTLSKLAMTRVSGGTAPH